MPFYDKFKTLINFAIGVIIVALLLFFLFKYQYNKGVSDGKNDPAIKAQTVNAKREEIRENIKQAVVIIEQNHRNREEELDRSMEENAIPEITDPEIKAKLEDPQQGITDEMFASLNKAREETNK